MKIIGWSNGFFKSLEGFLIEILEVLTIQQVIITEYKELESFKETFASKAIILCTKKDKE